MRPITLELAGFSAFREPCTLSFEGTDLLALVGPTGSGKSSIIDAITFALYGSVSRYDDDRLVEPAIHKLANEARISLDFELSGQRYTAVRVVRRTEQGATTREARLVRVHDDDSEDILAGKASEMTKAVLDLLGLNFDQFTRTVVLPQGDFAAFLHGDKSERQQLLRQLLDTFIYERMGKYAHERHKVSEAKATLLRDQRDERGAPTAVELAELKVRLKAVLGTQKSVGKELDTIAKLDAKLVTSQDAVERAEDQLTALHRIKVPAAVTKLAPKIAEAADAVTAAEADLKKKRAARTAAQKAVEGGPDALLLHRTMDALDRLDRLTTELAALQPDAEGLAAEATELRKAADAAAESLDAARETLDAAASVAGLGAVIAGLVVGEACPVCEQVVTELPAHDVDAEHQRAKKAHAAAQKTHTAAAKAADAVERKATQVSTRLTTLVTEQTAAQKDVPAKTDRAALETAIETAEVNKARLDDAAEEAELAEAAVDDARSAQEGLASKESDLRDDLNVARDSVAARKPPTLKGKSLDADWTALVAWSTEAVAEVEAELAVLTSARSAAEAERQTHVTTIETTCLSVDVRAVLTKVTEQLATAAADCEHRLSDAERRQADVARLTEEIAALEGSASLDKEMGQLLSVSGFERWLLQAALDDLVSRATVRLLELSGGQYSLESSDGDFSIRDHRNADELRGVRTLSGGETFLASLALALALAESIAELAVEGGPRIESMFLDEGFGTLDADTLDLVATTLEELSASGRLIGVVTHIRDLADRMPVRFEVHKDATTARAERVEV